MFRLTPTGGPNRSTLRAVNTQAPQYTMADREHEVRECAYYLWEAEGRPEGKAALAAGRDSDHVVGLSEGR
jgi:hypothetical protein